MSEAAGVLEASISRKRENPSPSLPTRLVAEVRLSMPSLGEVKGLVDLVTAGG